MKILPLLSIVVLSGSALFTPTFADAWPQWMGPQRDGVWRETELLEKFPDAGPRVLWRKEVNAGYSGPAVANGRVFLLDRTQGPPLERKPGQRGIPEQPGTERLLCLDQSNGNTLWDHTWEAPYRIDFPAGPRATPIIDTDRVYVLGAMGDLRCLKTADGQLLWSRNFIKDFGLDDPPTWGWAAHPLLHGEKLISLVGGTNSAVVAFDKSTGKELWRALTTREIGYAPPVIASIAGKDQLIVWHTEALAGLRPDTGEVLWTFPYPAEGKPQRPEVTIGMPRIDDGQLFVTSFYHGALMLKFTGEKPELLWNRKSTSRSSFNAGLHTTMTTPTLKDGTIYGICGVGELRALDSKTGERLWETREHLHGKETMFGTSFLIQQGDSGNRFFIWTDLGDLVLAELTPAKYHEISRANLLEPTENARGRDVVWSHPAFAGKSIFARNQKELIRVSLDANQG